MTCEYCGHTLERRDGCYRCPNCGAVDSAGDERDDWDEQHDGILEGGE